MDTGVLPAGIGILVVAADTTEVSENRVERNPFTGIALTSLCTGLALQGLPCDGLDIDPLPDRNRIVRNVVVGNGTVPVPDPTLDALRGDLSWDGTGSGNCWSRNRFSTSAPPSLPSCGD